MAVSGMAFLHLGLVLGCEAPAALAPSDAPFTCYFGGCDDGVFCNGLETCRPGHPAADVNGCVSGALPCGTAGCSEAGDGCAGCDPVDADGDGDASRVCGGDDCDDADALRSPARLEVCDADDRDEDCNPTTIGDRDADGDGSIDAQCCNEGSPARCGADCADVDATRRPDTLERCNGRDDDCDGETDEDTLVRYYLDVDGDGFGLDTEAADLCAPGVLYRALLPGDCRDDRPTVSPLEAERCNRVDDDCDGAIDEGTDEVCSAENDGAPSACLAGACAIVECPVGWGDCDERAWTGCEVDLTSDPYHCGTCDSACGFSTGLSCVSGACDVVDCAGTRHRCDGRCLSLYDATGCGEDCIVCAAPLSHGSATCWDSSTMPASAVCGVRCDANYTASTPTSSGEVDCLWNRAVLAGLAVEGGALDPTWIAEADPSAYFVRVPVGIATTRVLATLADGASALLDLDGAALASGVPSEPLALPIGETHFDVTVRAAGGATGTYGLTVTRGWSLDAFLKATNAGSGDAFGSALAADGDTIVIGAPAEASASSWPAMDPTDDAAPGAGAAYVVVLSGGTWTVEAYLKSPSTDSGDRFGTSVAIDGDTIVVGAPNEDSDATGVGGDASSDAAPDTGAAYVYRRTLGAWTLEGYLKPTRAAEGSHFGASVDVDRDTVIVGAPDERSGGVGVDSAPTPLPRWGSGAAYTFERVGTTWQPGAFLKASAPDPSDNFGAAVAISGARLAVGAPDEASAATGVGGDELDNSAWAAGAVYVFVRDLGSWRQEAFVKAEHAHAASSFGASVALDGDTLVVGAPTEDGFATGVDPAPAFPSSGSYDIGSAHVLELGPAGWAEVAYLKPSTPDQSLFGASVAVSGDVVLVGAPGDDSAGYAPGADPRPGRGWSWRDAGAAYSFVRSPAGWRREVYLKATNSGDRDLFGCAVATTDSMRVVGASSEDGAGNGIDPPWSDALPGSGAAYVFTP